MSTVTAVIAVGSNIGQRATNIALGLRALRDAGAGAVVDSSLMYESAPMYFETQPSFFNCVISLETALEPLALLACLKNIERAVGRTPSIRNGPRVLDLDIVLYGNKVVDEGDQLRIPHLKLEEREFVLRPLCDLYPELEVPSTGKTIEQMLTTLHALQPNRCALERVLPIRVGLGTETALRLDSKVYVMGILNTTPDSFSDGGLHVQTENAIGRAIEMLDEGADIVDVGGESTRPGAGLVSIDEEIQRVVPVIQGLRSQRAECIISVDTRKAVVARAAVAAGADIVNDVSGGAYDSQMFRTCADLQVPVVMMHMRGTPETMNTLAQYNDVVHEVVDELGQCLRLATAAGIPRYQQLVDPGIGFAKTGAHNLILLAHMRAFGALLRNRPIVLGVSRKKFLGSITGTTDPQERDWGTAAACAVGVSQGVEIVRVHNVKGLRQAVHVAKAIADVQS